MTELHHPAGEPKFGEWLPIESAPKDATHVIAYGLGECGPSEARHIEGHGWYLAGNDPTDAWGGPVYPTDWMPLPPPPEPPK